MAYKAEALVLIIDVNPSMNDALPGEDSLLQKSVTAANMIIQRKMFNDTKTTKNEASLILFGTDGTFNQLYEEGVESYEHITVAKEMGVMDLELLNFINKNVQVGSHNADFIDALVVAVDHLHNKCMGRKMEQKVILFTNLASEFADDKLAIIIKAFNDNDINLVFVGPELDDNNDGNDNEFTNPSGGHQKHLTQQQEIGSKCIHHILEQVDGEGISASEVLPLLSFFETRRKRQVTTFRGPIEIGSTLKINSYAYVKCQEEKPSSWKKSSALAEYASNGETLKVETQRSYHCNDEDQNEVSKENTAQAFRYGKTLVPMTADDKKSLKLETTKGCLVLGFTSEENVSRNLYSRNSCYIFIPQPEDEHAAVAFSALCHALEEKNMVAVVRFVSRRNTDPKIGFLTPHIKSSYESLMFVTLPFREDIRQYSFASLNGTKTKNTSFEQKQSINGLIDNMMLVREYDGTDGEIEELFKPKNILNPVTQRQCQCIQNRALNPDETRIPEIEEYILQSIRPIPEIAENCQVILNDIKNHFPLEEVTKKTKASNIFSKSNENDESEKKKMKLEQINGSEGFSLHGLSKSHVTEIDSVDPTGDFLILIEGANPEKFSEICKQMKDCILKLILDSFLDQYYRKALNCLKIMGNQCQKVKVSNVFNKLLVEIREFTLDKQKNDFWELLKKENIIPINKDIASDSLFTKEESINFFSPTEQKEAALVPDNLFEDEEDLLDML